MYNALCASGSYIVNLAESIKFLSVSVRLQRLPFASRATSIRNVLRDRELCAYGHNVECVCVREREKSCAVEKLLTREVSSSRSLFALHIQGLLLLTDFGVQRR
jgi:hypothetical protein